MVINERYINKCSICEVEVMIMRVACEVADDFHITIVR